MKKVSLSFFALAGLLLSSLAFAGGVSGGVVVIGGIEVAGGTVSGSASSISSGSAIAGSEVIGSGYSVQQTVASSGGAASIGGKVGFNGSTVQTATTQYATINSSGNVSGGAPLAAADGSIINGTTGFASSTNNAIGTSAFQKVGIGGIAGLGGTAAIQGF